MNAEELNKHFNKNALPLCPAMEDKPGKRVTLKADSGPGRTDLPMLAQMRLKGFYLTPSVPNTAAKTQETDQNCGPFKIAFRGNIRVLAVARHQQKKQMLLKDLALLVFGGTDSIAGVALEDSFNKAFLQSGCLSAWNKCGAVPLTRNPLEDEGIRHESMINADGTTLSDVDPEGLKLMETERENRVHCEFLKLLGHDSEHLRCAAPRCSTKKFELTVPHSKERIALLQRSSTAGQLFHATHGEHLNSDDFFVAKAKTERDARTKQLEKTKVTR